MTVKSAHELKRLNTQKERLKGEVAAIKQQISGLNREMTAHTQSIQKIDAAIESMTEKEIVVTEHAMLRFLERGMLIDLGQVKDTILSNSVLTQIKALGNGKFPIGNGLKAVVKNNSVVTVEK